MPRARKFLNGFSKEQVHKVTGLSRYMIDYLAREGFLEPSYRDETRGVRGATQGRVRYYSYRDLVVAKIIQQLREAGVRLPKLKAAMRILQSNDAWTERVDVADAVRWLVYDGTEVALLREDGFLDELRTGGQRAFSFIVGIENTKDEVRRMIDPIQRGMFTMENRELVLSDAAA